MEAVGQPRSKIGNSSRAHPEIAHGERKSARYDTFPKGQSSGVRTAGAAQRPRSADWGSFQARRPENSRKTERLTRAKLIILASLLCLWGAIALVRLPSETPVRPGGALTDIKGPRARGETAGKIPRLETKFLAIPTEQYPPQAANMFAALSPPPPPKVEAVRPPALPPSPPPPDPFTEAAKQLRFLGFLKSDARVAAFITRGVDLFIAAEGDTVAERFRVASVQEDAVTLAAPEGDKRVRLTLATAGGVGVAAIPMVSPAAASPQVAAASPQAVDGVTQEEQTGEVLAHNAEATPVTDPYTAAVIQERAERAARIGSRVRGL